MAARAGVASGLVSLPIALLREYFRQIFDARPRTDSWEAGVSHPTSCFMPASGHSATGTRTRVARVRAEYPNQLDYSGCCTFCPEAPQAAALQHASNLAGRLRLALAAPIGSAARTLPLSATRSWIIWCSVLADLACHAAGVHEVRNMLHVHVPSP